MSQLFPSHSLRLVTVCLTLFLFHLLRIFAIHWKLFATVMKPNRSHVVFGKVDICIYHQTPQTIYMAQTCVGLLVSSKHAAGARVCVCARACFRVLGERSQNVRASVRHTFKYKHAHACERRWRANYDALHLIQSARTHPYEHTHAH